MQNKVTKYHPILFSKPMVQAILEGRKTQTRRVIKPKYSNTDLEMREYNSGMTKVLIEVQNDLPLPRKNDNGTTTYNLRATAEVKCNYKVGDVLWVRENFYTAENWDHWKPSALASVNVKVYYQADIGNEYIPQLLHRGKIRPCIFLPSHYSRIFLKIKSIRVELLHDISQEDARAEGVEFTEGINGNLYYDYITMNHGCNEINSFMSLWESINGKKSLEKNPFVWVYEFENIEKPLDFIV